jgi:hypothetical protein
MMLGGSETLSDGCCALPELAALLNNNAAMNAITAWQLIVIMFPLLPTSAVPWDGDTADIAGRSFRAFFVFLPAGTRSQGGSTKNSLLPEPLCGLAARLVLCHTDVFGHSARPIRPELVADGCAQSSFGSWLTSRSATSLNICVYELRLFERYSQSGRSIRERVGSTFCAPILIQPGIRHSRGARSIRAGLSCPQSILSLSCPSFSHDRF